MGWRSPPPGTQTVPRPGTPRSDRNAKPRRATLDAMSSSAPLLQRLYSPCWDGLAFHLARPARTAHRFERSRIVSAPPAARTAYGPFMARTPARPDGARLGTG